MIIIKIQSLSHSQQKDIYTLWNNEYPTNLMYSSCQDFKNYLKNLSQKHHLLLIDDQEKVKGWYFDFERENENGLQ